MADKSHIAKPTPYDGSQPKFLTYLRQVRVYIRGHGTYFDTDEKKVLFALSYLQGGRAGPWADDYAERMEEANFTMPTWNAFVTKMTTRFADHDDKKHAAITLQHLQQKKMTADDYFTEFDQLARRAGMSDPVHDEYKIRLI